MTDTVTAHHDYESQQDDELSFIAGDTIKVTDHSNPDWWLGSKQDGSSGYFPSNFVEATKQDKEKSTETATTTPATAVDNDNVATTPSVPVAEDAAAATAATDAEHPQVETDQQQKQQRASIGMARVMEDYAMQQDDELTLHKGGIVVLYERSDNGEWLQGEINGKQGRFPAKYVEDIDMPGRPDLGMGNTDMTSGSGDAGAKAPPPGGFKLAAFGVKQGGIGSLLAGGIPTLKKTSTGKSPTTPSEPTATTTSPPPSATQQPEQQPNVPSLGKAIVLHPYDAENDDELHLIRGEYIDILDRHADDGWWQGRNEKNQTGVFPSNFVKEIEHDQQANVAPPVRTRKSVASVGAIAATSPIVPPPSESRPFSTPTPSLQQQQSTPPPISQRLPPLPDTRPPMEEDENDDTITTTTDQVKKNDTDSMELKEPLDTPVKDSAPSDILSPATSSPSPPPRVETSLPAANLALVDQEEEEEEENKYVSPKEQEQDNSTQQQETVETKQVAKQQQPPIENVDRTESPTTATTATTPTAAPAEKEEHAELDKKDDDLTPKQEETKDTTAASVDEPELKDAKVEDVGSKTSVTIPPVAEPAEEHKVDEQQTLKTDDDGIPAGTAEEEPTSSETVEEEEEARKGIDFGLPLPTSGPRLVSPSRTGRPSTRPNARRPPTKQPSDDATPSQTELLQQELEKTPEEEKPAAADSASPTSPPPKPIKPIFAKFPTPFAMGGGEGISAKNLKPVQRRMFEPSPAHEASTPSPPLPTSNNDDDTAAPSTGRPTPGGVRGLASRFAGIPNAGGSNEVMETKLKNFTKNEVEKTRKEFESLLEVERSRIASLEAMVESLMLQVDQLKNGGDTS